MSSRWTALWLLLAGGLLAAEPQHVDHPIAEEVADQVDHLRAQAVGGSVKVDEVQRALRDLEQLRLRTQNRLGVLTRELQVAQQRLAEFPPDEAVPPAGAPPTPRQSALARLDTLKQFLRDNQRNADAIGNLSTELAEKDKQIRHRDELDEVEGRLGSETPNWSQLNQLVVKVTDVRGRIAARVSRIETELEETQQSLATLLPELAPADNAAAKGNGAANGAAPLTSPTPANEAAAPTGPEPGRDMEALLADQSPEVADAARRLETQRKQLRRWLGEYRLQLLRADDLRRRMEQQIQQQAAAELLQAGPSLPAAIRQAAGRPEQWVSFYGRIVEGSVVPTLSRRPALLVGLVLLLAVLLPPLPAKNHRQAQCDAANQAGTIVPEPIADAFALFVLVEQIINRHAYSCPVRPGS